MMITRSIVVVLLGLILMLLPVALMIVLQVWLCKRENRWLGLILPALSLCLSAVICLGVAVYSVGSVRSEMVVDGQVVEMHEEVIHPQGSDLLAVAAAFLVFNIPTIIYGGIWLSYRNRRGAVEDLKKMNIQDLE